MTFTIMFEARLCCRMCYRHETVTVVSKLGSKPSHDLSDGSDAALLAAGWAVMGRTDWYCPDHAYLIDHVPGVRRG